jgi:hypothetical protein
LFSFSEHDVREVLNTSLSQIPIYDVAIDNEQMLIYLLNEWISLSHERRGFFFGAVSYSPKGPTNFVTSVCPSVLGCHWTDFREM